MNTAHQAGRETTPAHSASSNRSTSDRLSSWLESSKTAQELAKEIRQLCQQLTAHSEIDRLEVRAAQSWEFAKPAGLLEKTLNFFGHESSRQIELKTQGTAASALAEQAKAGNATLEEAITGKIETFCASTLRRSEDLTVLTSALEQILTKRNARLAAWDSVDREASAVNERLRPKPIILPAPGLEYGPNTLSQIANNNYWPYPSMGVMVCNQESRAEEESRRRCVQGIYDAGYKENRNLFNQQLARVAELSPTIKRGKTFEITSSQGVVLETIHPPIEELARLAAACSDTLDALQRFQQTFAAGRYDVDLDRKAHTAPVHVEAFERDAAKALESIRADERKLKEGIAAYFRN